LQTKVQPIDSKEKLLSGPNLLAEYFAKVGEANNKSSADMAPAMQKVALTAQAPNADYVQIGNTAFLGVMGTKKGAGRVMVSVYNVDTVDNFIINLLKYNNYMLDKNISEAFFVFGNYNSLGKIVNMAGKIIQGLGGNAVLAKGKDSTQASVLISPTKEKIPSENIPKLGALMNKYRNGLAELREAAQ